MAGVHGCGCWAAGAVPSTKAFRFMGSTRAEPPAGPLRAHRSSDPMLSAGGEQ